MVVSRLISTVQRCVCTCFVREISCKEGRINFENWLISLPVENAQDLSKF